MDTEKNLVPEMVTETEETAEKPLSDANHPVCDYIPECAKPDVHEAHTVGNGMSPREAMKIRMQSMSNG